MADDDGILHAHLADDINEQDASVQAEDKMDKLVEKISEISVSDSIQTPGQLNFELYSDSVLTCPTRLPLGLRNSASIFQELYSDTASYFQQVPLGGLLHGSVFTSTPEGNIVHWPLQDTPPSSRVVSMLSQLPFQEGFPLPVISEQGSIEIIVRTESTGSGIGGNLPYSHNREIFMLR